MSQRVDYRKLVKQIPHRIQLQTKSFYEILWVDSFKDIKVMGETRFEPRQIVIRKGMTPKETVVTFLHEVAHAYSEEFNMGLTENQILNFEKGLYYLLKTNNIFNEGSSNE
jgi:hypothetical protein